MIGAVAVGLVAGLAHPWSAAADDSNDASVPVLATATTQRLPGTDPDLLITVAGQKVNPEPFRVRLLNQASPNAYSMDIYRGTRYGDRWTAINLGRSEDDKDRALPQVGVNNPTRVIAIARGDQPDGTAPVVPDPTSPDADFEFAARQIAIWHSTNNLPLTAEVVPNPALLRRAIALYDNSAGYSVPLQPANHSVNVFVRQTTGNSVDLAVTLGVDPNTSLTEQATIDLYLDGVRCTVKTRALTQITLADDGTYRAGKPTDYSEDTHSNLIAEVHMKRNTKLVDVIANWVNVEVTPGMVMSGEGDAPPLVTAETATLNFASTARLDPSTYTSPADLLSNAGTTVLTWLPQSLILIAIVFALYALPRAGRAADKVVVASWVKVRGKKPEASVRPHSTDVEAATETEAVKIGIAALGLTSPSAVDIVVLQAPVIASPGTPATPALVRISKK